MIQVCLLDPGRIRYYEEVSAFNPHLLKAVRNKFFRTSVYEYSSSLSPAYELVQYQFEFEKGNVYYYRRA